MHINVTMEAIDGFKAEAESVQKSIEVFESLIQRVQTVADNQRDMIGPYGLLFDNALNQIKYCLTQVREPVIQVADILTEIAEGYYEILSDHCFTSASVVSDDREQNDYSSKN